MTSEDHRTTDDYADLARHAEAALELTPGEWEAGQGWVYTRPVYSDDNRLASVLGMKFADADRAAQEEERAQRNVSHIAAANPATILRLIAENRALAARLAAVEALADEWERRAQLAESTADARAGLSDEVSLRQHAVVMSNRAEDLRAALSAAPTDTTKETDR